jgi:PEP-CTERM motif-containing protein
MVAPARLSIRGFAVFLVGVLALLAPITAKANGVYHCPNSSSETCFINTGGNTTQSGTGIGQATLSLSGSEVTSIGWESNSSGLGTLNFTTGTLTSGTLAGGGIFSSSGSSFVLTGTYNGITNGLIFNGAFTGNITWNLIGGPGGAPCTSGVTCTYDLSGNISGNWGPNGIGPVTGATVQVYYTTIGPYNGGTQSITNAGGISYVNTPVVTPEPAALGLMGTGIVGIGLAVRRRSKRYLRHVHNVGKSQLMS